MPDARHWIWVGSGSRPGLAATTRRPRLADPRRRGDGVVLASIAVRLSTVTASIIFADPRRGQRRTGLSLREDRPRMGASEVRGRAECRRAVGTRDHRDDHAADVRAGCRSARQFRSRRHHRASLTFLSTAGVPDDVVTIITGYRSTTSRPGSRRGVESGRIDRRRGHDRHPRRLPDVLRPVRLREGVVDPVRDLPEPAGRRERTRELCARQRERLLRGTAFDAGSRCPGGVVYLRFSACHSRRRSR